MIFTSHSSGVGAEISAWKVLGWKCNFATEESAFRRDVLLKNWPELDVLPEGKALKDYYGTQTTELLFSGHDLHPVSLSGFRAGLDDAAGNPTFHLLGGIERHAPRWVVWAGVPGTLQDDKRSFETFLQGLAKLGYGFAYRVLDAQHFGSPQRLRRLYVVAHAAGSWQRAAAVLFDAASLCGHPAPLGESEEDAASDLDLGTEEDRVIQKFDSLGIFAPRFAAPLHPGNAGRKSHSKLNGSRRTTIVIEKTFNIEHSTPNAEEVKVRRLATVEYERLMGLPDDHTKLDNWEDLEALRYSAVGGALPVPVLRWIGERIKLVEDLMNSKDAKAQSNS